MLTSTKKLRHILRDALASVRVLIAVLWRYKRLPILIASLAIATVGGLIGPVHMGMLPHAVLLFPLLVFLCTLIWLALIVFSEKGVLQQLRNLPPKFQEATIPVTMEAICGTLGNRTTAIKALGLLASDQFERAAEEFKKLRSFANPTESVRISILVGRCYQEAGNLRLAKTSYREALVTLNTIRASYQKSRTLKNLRVAALNNLGSTIRDQGRHEVAVRLFQRTLHLAKDAGADPTPILGNLGIAHRLRGDFPSALRIFREAERINCRRRRRFGYAEALANIAITLRHMGQPKKEVEDAFLQAIEATAPSNRKHLARSIAQLAILLIEENPHKAMMFFKQAATLADNAGAEKEMADSLASQGILYAKQGEHVTAREYYQRALSIESRIGYWLGFAKTLRSLAFSYCSKVNQRAPLSDPRPIRLYSYVIRLFTKLGALRERTITLIALGSCELHMGLLHDAIRDLDEAQRQFDSTDDKQNLADALLQLGIARKALAQREGNCSGFTAAAETLERAASLFLPCDLERAARAFFNGGDSWKQAGEDDKACLCFGKSAQMNKDTGKRELEAHSRYELGQALARMGSRSPARKELRRALEINEELGLDRYVEKCQKKLSRMDGR